MSNVHRLLAVAALLCAAPAVADIAGGGDPATDCLVVLRGLTPTGAVGKKKHRIPVVECQDGDAACDADGESQGSCTFAFRVCADEPGMASCTPGEIRTFRSRKGGLLLPPGGTAEATCAEPSTVVVPVRRKRCANNTAVSCHPTARGGPGIVRTGRAAPPVPAWPESALPKTAAGTVLAATFCIPATGTNTVDTTTGLPGPGALLLEADATIRGGAR